MKGGAENRKKTIAAGGLGAVALCCLVYAYTQLFGGSTNPAAVTPAATTASTTSTRTKPDAVEEATRPVPAAARPATRGVGGSNANGGLGIAPGVAAAKLASTSSSLDPTLNETAMLRTEGLVYSGAGRNIFSATYGPAGSPFTPPTTGIHVRQKPQPYVPPPPPPPPPTCPPTCPPINLKFFGTATRSNGVRQAFLLQGEDVYLASQGDIVARKYRIMSIGGNSVQVMDLSNNNNTQTLPLAAN